MSKTNKEEIGRMSYIGEKVMPSREFNLLATATTIMVIVLGWVSAGSELFTRIPGTLGKRYLSVTRLFMAWMILGSYTTLVTFIQLLRGNQWAFFTGQYVKANSQAFTLYYWFVILLAAFHLYKMRAREKAGIRWHSQSFGKSWLHYLFPRVGYWKIYTIMEPSLFLAVALIVYRFDSVLGTWLIVSGAALALRNIWTFFDMEGRVLDIQDAQIEADFFASAMRGQDIEDTAGFVVLPATVEPSSDQLFFDFDDPAFVEEEEAPFLEPEEQKKKGRPKSNAPASVDL